MPKLSDHVIRSIQQDIAAGNYTTGNKIPAEPELMQRYEVGRSTVREAIKTLAISGVLRVQQGDGTYVNSAIPEETLQSRLRRADVHELNEVRALFELEIVRLAALTRTTEDVEAIRQALTARAGAIAANKYKDCADADIAFHLAVARAAGNKVLYDLYENFTSTIRNFFTRRDIAEGLSYFSESHKRHERLYKAILKQQPDKAVTTMQSILKNNF